MSIEKEIKSKKFRSQKMKAMLNVIFTANWWNAHTAEELKPFDLTISQFNVLRILRGSMPDSLPVQEIKARMLDKTPNMTRLLGTLEKKEMIERLQCADDRRIFHINISEKGLKTLGKIDVKMKRSDQRINITEEEAILLSDLLDKVRS
ncbi:MarR family transcriptional regulator [Persicobacter psychrovividus]|uniref:MarR family transcriptional regulator n=1 Tax=Persicobacter psychrovividus TaxID=387638 RepID=A0ABM7VJA4_9BACT|nr:MarR family transcriptional regulator [Persicobacter psychrovividus]